MVGPGHLVGAGFDGQVHYTLTHVSRDIGAPHLDNSSAVVGSTVDTITGRLEILPGTSLAPGLTMELTLVSGRKLKVITDFDGRVTATGGFY